MKLTIVSVVLLVSLAACSGGGGDATPAEASAPESNSAPPTQPGTSTPNFGSEAPVPTAPDPEPLTRYSVYEIDIAIPGADTVTPTHLGSDDRSIAGTWSRKIEDGPFGDPYYDIYPFVQPWGGKTEIGFEEIEPMGENMLVSHYEGRFLAGAYAYKLPVGSCAPQESYILDTKKDRVTPVGGAVRYLNKKGEAAGSLGGDPICFPLGETAFYWNGEIFKTIPDQTAGSHGFRLRDGKVEGVQGDLGFDDPSTWETVFVWDLATGIVTHYLPGDPAGPSFDPEPLPDAATLHEQIDEEDFWFGRLTFTRVRDVGRDGCILVEGCSIDGCGSFLLIPPQ